ncbi:hypothetical protein [Paraburkholderia sp. GAS334]|uniref:hypothetical protein n=1 Tax=Paraburkholderia sp. GAS334 TaxID=3035131 RepID=UPI003D21879A
MTAITLLRDNGLAKSSRTVPRATAVVSHDRSQFLATHEWTFGFNLVRDVLTYTASRPLSRRIKTPRSTAPA